MKKNNVKNVGIALAFFCFIFIFSGCWGCQQKTIDYLYNGMWFLKHNDDAEKYYCAGKLDKDEGIETYFIPYSIDNIPVKQLNYTLMMYTSAGCIQANYDLKNLYIPGSIENVSYGTYFLKAYGERNEEGIRPYLYNDLKIYYSGKVIDLKEVITGADYFVPAKEFEQFYFAYYDNGDYSFRGTINKANISYRLNADDMAEYYYVDNAEYGEKIVNIPPEPTREGYTFEGWYTESECINEWCFDNTVPQLAEGENFKELCLYAKWFTE